MIEFNKNYVGDSDKIIKLFQQENLKFDLILTDPPYNLNKDFGNDSDCLELEQFLKITKKRIKSYSNILTNYGSIVWFGIHKYIGYIQIIMYETGLFYRTMNIWHYENGFSRNRTSPLGQYEPFLCFSKSNKKWTYNVDDVRIPYKSTDRLKNNVYYKNAKGERCAWVPNPKGAMRGDIWDFPTLAGKAFAKEKNSHPTQKPESLITEIIKAYCPKDKNGKYCGTILDPFHGSGTLGVCCEKLNREGHNIKWIGIELEEKWSNICNERLKKVRGE